MSIESQGGSSEEFHQEALAGRQGLMREIWDFLRFNKKWWLLPIVIVLGVLGLLVVLAGTGAAPFIYTLF